MDSAHNAQAQQADTPRLQFVRNSLEKTYPRLADQDHVAWREIVNSANLVNLPAGMTLLQPHSPCMHFMLLLDGCVRVYQQTPNDREVTLYRTYGGDLCVLSINGLIEQSDFGAFAQAETDVTALAFSRAQFMRAMAGYEPFCEFILGNLTGRFNDVLALMEETAFESLDTRLICLLARLARDSEDRCLHITHQDLARELGSTREVISRLLKGIEKQGCIEMGRGVIRVLI